MAKAGASGAGARKSRGGKTPAARTSKARPKAAGQARKPAVTEPVEPTESVEPVESTASGAPDAPEASSPASAPDETTEPSESAEGPTAKEPTPPGSPESSADPALQSPSPAPADADDLDDPAPTSAPAPDEDGAAAVEELPVAAVTAPAAPSLAKKPAEPAVADDEVHETEAAEAPRAEVEKDDAAPAAVERAHAEPDHAAPAVEPDAEAPDVPEPEEAAPTTAPEGPAPAAAAPEEPPTPAPPARRTVGRAKAASKAAPAASTPSARPAPRVPPPGPATGTGLPEEIGGYRILGTIGRGGMGAVYRARDADGRIVALKLLHAHLDDPDARERLTREVASLQKVRHAGVARVLDAEIESTEAFVVTELVNGRDLGRHVALDGPMPIGELAALAARLREALDVVHGAGVLHRDLTPGNVMVTADGPVLIDFGLAQAVEDARVTSTGLVTGTPGYVSPDLLDGEAPTRASDWWGWAAVLTFAATGRPPFGRGAIGTVLTRVRAGEPDLAGVAGPIADVLRKALAVAPADRPAPGEVVAALEAAAEAAPDEADVADLALDEDVTDEDASGGNAVDETVVVTAVGLPEDLRAEDEWVHDGGTTVMPAVSSETEVWAAEDDEAYAEAYDDAYDDGYSDDAHDQYGADQYGGEPYDRTDDHAPYGEPAAFDDAAMYPPPPARRTGTVAALALPFLALGLARPGLAFVVALVVAALLRSVELDAEALERRRARAGARPRDRLRAVLSWPWYLVRGGLGVVPVLVVGGAVVVLVGGVLWWLIEAGHWTVAPLVPGQGSGLLRGNLPWVGRAWVGLVAALGLLMVWFGPMARTHRDGARRVLAKAAPGVPGALAAVVVGVAVAAVLATVMLGQDVVWWPMGGPPDIG